MARRERRGAVRPPRTTVPSLLRPALCLAAMLLLAWPTGAQSGGAPETAGGAGTSSAAAGAATPAPAAYPPSRGPRISTGFFIDLSLLGGLDTREPVQEGYAPTADDFARFAGRPAFGSAGVSISVGGFSAITALDLHQDFGAYLMGESWSNLPKAPGAWSLMWGNSYPQVGYASWSSRAFYVSGGRRKVGLGPGTGSMSVSAENPWSDHLVAAVGANVAGGTVGYAFSVVGVQRWSSEYSKKTVFSHRLSWAGDRFAVSVGELNLVVGDSIDLQDIGPFLVYHHLFNTNSNVMLDLSLEAVPFEGSRVYGQFVLDDLRVGEEGESSNPTAMGFLAGAEFLIARREARDRPVFFRDEYALRVGPIPARRDGGLRATNAPVTEGDGTRGGVRIGLEVSAASKYLYRRSAAAFQEAWTGRYAVQTSTGLGWPLIEPFLAYPAAPDTRSARLSASWVDGAVESSLSARYRVSGPGAGTYAYSPPYDADWFGLGSPVAKAFDLGLGMRWTAARNLLVSAGLSLSLGDAGTVFSAGAGLSWRFGSGGARTGLR